MKIYIDGKYYDPKNAKISVFDHGLLYGDGIFEGIRAYNGRVFKLTEHIDRLFCSAKAILLKIPLSHEAIVRAVVETCRRNRIRDGYIRLVEWINPQTGDVDSYTPRLDDALHDLAAAIERRQREGQSQ